MIMSDNVPAVHDTELKARCARRAKARMRCSVNRHVVLNRCAVAFQK